MSRADESYTRPLSAAIAEGATTPNPGLAGAVVYSTTAGMFLRWSGTAWLATNGTIRWVSGAAATAGDGTVTWSIPAGTFTAVTTALVTVFGSANAAYVSHVVSLSTTSVTVRALQLNQGVLLGGSIYTSPTGLTVRVAVMGTR